MHRPPVRQMLRIFPAFVADVVQVVQPLHILIELVQVQLRIGCGGQVM